MALMWFHTWCVGFRVIMFPAPIRRLGLQAAAQPTGLDEACRALGQLGNDGALVSPLKGGVERLFHIVR